VSGERTWVETAGRIGRIGALVLFAAVLGRGCLRETAALDGQIAALGAQDRVIIIKDGDIAWRDAPKAHEFLQGRFFSDPYYAGEHHWYPFLTPLVAAAVSKVSGGSIPESFFRAEIGFVALSLASLGVLLFVLLRWQGLLLLPVLIWLGAVPPGHGLYPIESSRAPLCLFLAFAGVVLEGPLSPRRALGLGASVGILGLWSGAPFFTAAAVAGLIAVIAGERSLRKNPRELLRWLPPLVLGALVPLALLLAPELVRHGGFAVPQAARTWQAEVYGGGTLAKALTLPLAPRGIHLVLALLAMARVALGGKLGLPSRRRAVPLVLAAAGAVLMSHVGFPAADAGHPGLARLAQSILPAPAHTFLAVAQSCRPAVEGLGLAALIELVGLGIARLRPAWRPPFTALVPVAAAAGYALLLFLPPAPIARFDTSQTKAFDRFGVRVGELVQNQPVFFRFPGKLVQSTSLKILVLGVDEYANPYVHGQRDRDALALDAALHTDNTAAADALLDRYAIAFVMEDPRTPSDPVIRRCGGAVLAEQDGFRLRRRTPCVR